MNDAQDKQIAAQALKALQLRRQLDRGELSQQEYLDCLNGLQTTPEPAPAPALLPAAESPDTGFTKSPPVATEPLPEISVAADALQFRPYEEPETPARFAEESARYYPGIADDRFRAPAAPAIITAPTEDRFLAMKCPKCAANLSIYDRTTELRCGDCGLDVVVERKHCTIALRSAAELLTEKTHSISASAVSAKTAEELKKLRAEATMVNNVKRSAMALGGLCGLVFGYTGITDMAARQLAMGISILFCSSALLGTVICITRHTSRVRADLNARIRAITTNDECVAGL